MRPNVNTENPWVLRTDFSDQLIWEQICTIIQEPVDGFSAYVDFINDADYEGVIIDHLLTLVPKNYKYGFIMIVDQIAISNIDHPLLIVNLTESSNASFRAIPSTVQAIENNLSIGNMDFEEFAHSVDESGIFRDFPEE